MPKRDISITLRQMRDYSKKAVDLSRGKKRGDLDKDLVLNLALTRLLEVIGEAADRIPRSFQEQHSEIEWSQIIGMRN